MTYVTWVGLTDFLDFTHFLASQQKCLLASFEIKKLLLKHSAVTIKANSNHRSWLLYLISLFIWFSLSLYVQLHVIKYSWSLMSSCWAILSHTKHHNVKLLRINIHKKAHPQINIFPLYLDLWRQRIFKSRQKLFFFRKY